MLVYIYTDPQHRVLTQWVYSNMPNKCYINIGYTVCVYYNNYGKCGIRLLYIYLHDKDYGESSQLPFLPVSVAVLLIYPLIVSVHVHVQVYN